MSRQKENNADPKQSSADSEKEKTLDDAFKSFLEDMKPFVLSLPDKRDRQRIALWIKKLCVPVGKKLSERKNRNLYAQILFQMLRRDDIQEPFDETPKQGPLLTLPAYMSRYLDKPLVLGNAAIQENRKHPDWIRGELPSSDSAFSDTLAKQKADTIAEWASSPSPTLFARSSPIRQYLTKEKYQLMNDSESLMEDSTLENSDPQLLSHHISILNDSLEDSAIEPHQGPSRKLTPPPSPVRRRLESRFAKRNERNKTEDAPSTRPKPASYAQAKGFYRNMEEPENQDPRENELQAKTKQLEARFAEERLSLQQELDQTVRKVLDRKNTELEEIKSQFRKNLMEYEEVINRQDKKLSRLARDLNNATNRNEKEVAELKAIIQQNHVNAEHKLERKVQDKIAEFEEEKFMMQKEHAQHVQELLDQTSERLKSIEKEYMSRTDASANKINEMEAEIYQIKRSRDMCKKEIEDLNMEKEQLREKLTNTTTENEDLNSKLKSAESENSKNVENYDKALRELRRKTDSTIERMKKENSEAAYKASEVIADQDTKINQYKQALQDSELQRKRELREMESTQRQETIRIEVNNDKTVRNLKSDVERLETELQNKQNLANENMREKSAMIKQLEDRLKEQGRQAQIAIEDFKMQAEETSRKTFQDMKQQIEKVETDLKTSNHEKEMQMMKSNTEIDSLISNYDKQICDLKNGYDEEKLRFQREAEAELTARTKEREKEQESLKSTYQQAIKESEEQHRLQRDSDSKKLHEYEQTIRDLRDEVIQANSLRKQQLVELGMLREEEKQNFQRQEEAMTSKFQSQMEQQRLALQNQHSTEMERMLEATNTKLKDIEREYSLSSDKNQIIITQLQSQVAELTDRVSREQNEAQMRVNDLSQKHEIEKAHIKKHHESAVKSLNQDIEMHRARSKQIERKFQESQLQSEESISRLKLEYEEKIRGLLPNSARNELEDTIQALREQISVIQSRAMLLQEELENRDELQFSFENNHPEFASTRH